MHEREDDEDTLHELVLQILAPVLDDLFGDVESYFVVSIRLLSVSKHASGNLVAQDDEGEPTVVVQLPLFVAALR